MSSVAWQADRVRSATTTIFAEMSALALATQSVNLGQGFPDTDGPDFMLDEARAAIAGGLNQYPPGRGIRPLREAIAEHSRRHYGLSYDPDSEVLVTTGATEALAAAILAFVNPGEEVIALEPFYDSYAASIDLAGGRRVGVGLFGPDFRLDHAELAAAFTDRTKAVLINSPHNPTGVVLDRADLAEIARLATLHDVLVICDEVYEHLVFDDAEHLPLAAFPGMRPRTLRISSAGKTFSATGWKIGWALGPPELVTAVTAVKQFLTYVSGAPFQPAVARALNEGDEWVARSRPAAAGQAGPAGRRLAHGRAGAAHPAGDVLHDHRRTPAGLCRRRRVLPRSAGALWRGGHPAPGVLRPRGGRPPVRAVGVLQGRRGAGRGHHADWAGSTRPVTAR